MKGRPYKKYYKRSANKRSVTMARIKKYVDRNIENKQTTGSMVTSFGSLSSSWIEVDPTSISQGVTGNTRVGRKVRIKSLEIRAVISSGANELLTDDPYNVVRICIAWWSGAAAANPLFVTGTTIDAPIRKNLGTRNYLLRKLIDKYVTLTVTSTEKGGGDGYTAGLRQFKYYKSFRKGVLITWGDDTVSYPDKRLIISMISDSAAITNPGVIRGYFVLTYEDA